MTKDKDQSFYYNIFDDICEGSSRISVFGRDFFVKHPMVSDFVKLELVKVKEYNKCIEKGILTKEQLISQMKESGIYPHALEEDINKIKIEIETTESFISSQIRKVIKDRERLKIKKLTVKMQKLQAEFNSLMFDDHADAIADRRSYDFFIFDNIYLEQECKVLAFEDHHEMSKVDLDAIYVVFEVYGTSLSNNSIEELVVADFFRPYYQFANSCQEFFGRPAKDLSQNQVSLLYYASLFKKVFKDHGDKIPDRIRNDPRAIIDHVNGSMAQEEMSQKSESRMDKTGSNFVVGTKFGATKEDYSEAGIQGNFLDLSELTKGGKTLNTEQAMKAFTKQAGVK